MECSRFAAWTRCRIGLAAGGLAASWFGLATQGSTPTAARKKHKKKQAKQNGFGCVDAGNFCKNGGQCCSGICQGKKGKKKCQGHNASTCQAGQQEEVCSGELSVPCLISEGVEGQCDTTTGNAPIARATASVSSATRMPIACRSVGHRRPASSAPVASRSWTRGRPASGQRKTVVTSPCRRGRFVRPRGGPPPFPLVAALLPKK